MPDEQNPKEVTPMVLEPASNEGSPMTTTIVRPGYVEERPPVGDRVGAAIEPQPNQDPGIINQPSARGDAVAQPGTPDTIDPETGYETNTTSVAAIEAAEAQAAADAAAEKEAKKVSKIAKAEDASYETNTVPELQAELDRRNIAHTSSLVKADLIDLLEKDDKGANVPKTDGGSKP